MVGWLPGGHIGPKVVIIFILKTSGLSGTPSSSTVSVTFVAAQLLYWSPAFGCRKKLGVAAPHFTHANDGKNCKTARRHILT